MLSRIFIKNFALIDTLDIHLHKGLQVITGETGAGKSIILGALRLILGERADVKAIADSESKSIVEAHFAIPAHLEAFFTENDLDFDQNSIIRREILPSGKSRAFVNDVPVTLDILRELSAQIIDIQSHFETSNLFNETYQFSIIDGLSENKSLLPKYQEAFSDYRKMGRELEELKRKLAEGNKESDYKTFLLNELQEADLDQVDLEDLQEKLSLHENVGQISENLSHILGRFDQEEIGILDGLLEVKNRFSRVSALSHHFSPLDQRFNENFLELKDILFDIQNEAEKLEVDPLTIEELNAKLNSLQLLFQKHQVSTVAELIALRDVLAGEQQGFEELDRFIADAEARIKSQQKYLADLAGKLSGNRKKSLPVFSGKMQKLLKDLGLEKAKIEVQLTDVSEFNPFGKETVAILFQANSGFPLKPIQTAISGGERSRVMLAIKKIMAENAELPTLILDEIDTGVSGKIADEMGKLMHEMAKDMQLIVITHLAQVAAKGDNNYKVLKEEVNGKTQSTIIALSEEEKLQEIAQLLSGATVTEAAVSQAKELMK